MSDELAKHAPAEIEGSDDEEVEAHKHATQKHAPAETEGSDDDVEAHKHDISKHDISKHDIS